MSNSDFVPQSNYNHIEMIDDEMMDMLREYSQDNPELLEDIIQSFEPEASVLIKELKGAIDTQDISQLKAAAHSLAGISGSIGAARLKAVCTDVENNIKKGNDDFAVKTAELLFPVYDELIDVLRQM